MAEYPDPRPLTDKDTDYIMDYVGGLLDAYRNELREEVDRIGEIVCHCATGSDRDRDKELLDEEIKANRTAIKSMRRTAVLLRRVKGRSAFAQNYKRQYSKNLFIIPKSFPFLLNVDGGEFMADLLEFQADKLSDDTDLLALHRKQSKRTNLRVFNLVLRLSWWWKDVFGKRPPVKSDSAFVSLVEAVAHRWRWPDRSGDRIVHILR